MTLPPSRPFFALLAALVVGAGTVAGQTEAFDAAAVTADLAGPVRVATSAGRDLTGRVQSVGDGRLVLAADTERGGEVAYTLAFAEVRAVALPGRETRARAETLVEAGELSAARPYLDALWRQRRLLLPLLGETEAQFFAAFASAERLAGRPIEAIAIARTLEPLVADPRVRRGLADEQLLAHEDLGLDAETRAAAEAWIAAAPAWPDSVLGWVVLGRRQLAAGQPETAARTVLDGILRAGARRAEHLDSAYALAREALLLVPDEPAAAALAAEAAARGLALSPSLADPPAADAP